MSIMATARTGRVTAASMSVMSVRGTVMAAQDR